jgi:abortive infection bacteriophage resistance protein
MKFAKPSLTISDQIKLLQRRGMTIPDHAAAEHYLRHISYYRLRAYWLPFEGPVPAEGDHAFANKCSFDDAISLYVFDRRLRLLIMDAIERVEVSIRAGWAHQIAVQYGPHGYLDATVHDRPDRHAQALSSLIDEIERSKDTFIVHYKNKYDDPIQPPIWMASEILSLGQLSKWVGNLKFRHDRKAIAKPYGLDEKILVSALHHLTYVRNICAHHGRLWNKQFTVTMIAPNSPGSLKLAVQASDARRIYNTLTMLGYLLGIISPGTDWKVQLVKLLGEFPLVDVAAMGFPSDWQDRPAWRPAVNTATAAASTE